MIALSQSIIKDGTHKQESDFIIIFPEEIRLYQIITGLQTRKQPRAQRPSGSKKDRQSGAKITSGRLFIANDIIALTGLISPETISISARQAGRNDRNNRIGMVIFNHTNP